MADIKKRIALRSREGGVHESLQSLLEASAKAQSRADQQRREGEGLHEYVRRVSAGSLKVVSRQELSELRRQIEILTNRQQTFNSPRVQTVGPDTRTLVTVGGPHHGSVVQLRNGMRELRLTVESSLSAADIRPDALGRYERTVTVHAYHSQWVDNIEALFHTSVIPLDGNLGLDGYAVARREMRNAYRRAGEPIPGG